MTDSGVLVGGVRVASATLDRLRRHVAELVRWNKAINLVAASTLPDAWERHVSDSAQLVPLAPANPSHWVDLGSGAGFPGLVVAIILAETSPETRVTLVESDRRKATFLREVARAAGLATTIIAERIETTTPLGADVVSARALAPLDALIPLAARHMATDGTALFPKGARADKELASAAATWSFSVERLPSTTDTTAEVLRMKGLKHV
jgi:16S rRNA (guanine527-N7)-methyltransferase